MPSVTPEILEPRRRKLGVAYRVLNVLVAEVSLKRPRIMPLGCQRKAAGVPQHVGVCLEPKVCLHARTLDHAGKPGGAERCPRSDVNTKGDFGS